MKNMAKKYINRIKFLGLSIWDALIYVISSANHEESQSSLTVIYLGDFLQARIPRLAKAAHSAVGMHTILITFKSNDYKEYNTEYFDKQFSYRTYWQLKSILNQLPKDAIVHAFGPPNWSTKIAIKMGFKTIMDCQDMTVTNYGLNPSMLHLKMDIPNEKYCLENCHGLISQSMEAWNAFKVYGIKNRPKTLFFPIMCNEEQFIEATKEKLENELHLVYVGGVVEKAKTHPFHQGLKIHWLIESLNEQKIHLHLYPAPSMSQAAIDEYTKLGEEYPYFRIHQSLPQNQLSKEIARYHYGILPFFDKTAGRNIEKRRYGTSLKLFNYMEAGLPCIISEDLQFQAWMSTRYGGGIKVKYEEIFDLKTTLRKYNYSKQLDKLKIGREMIGLNKNVENLISFYKEILE